MSLSYNAPNQELAEELSEVRADAIVLESVIESLNAPLPDSFPRSATLELAKALQDLASGTGRGAIEPLYQAQQQLSSIRSDYIKLSKEHTDSDNPTLSRGDLLDQRIRDLIGTVSTALQTARRLASENSDERFEPEGSVRVEHGVTLDAAFKHSAAANKEWSAEIDHIEQIQIQESVNANNLKRQLVDLTVLNRIGFIELKLPRAVTTRLRRVSEVIIAYPELLKKTSDAIRVGADIFDYASDKWGILKKRIRQAGTETAREISDDLRRLADRLEAKRRGGPKVENDKESDEPPADFNLSEAAFLIHAGQPVPAAWRKHITRLPMGNRKIRNLGALQGLSELKNLYQVSVHAIQFEALSDLTGLTWLDLHNTRIGDLSCLSRMTHLKFLYLQNTYINDLTPLSGMLKLENLNLSHTTVSDISPIIHLPLLRDLNLSNTNVRDIGTIVSMPNLEILDISNTRNSDYNFLRQCNKIEQLFLRNTDISDGSIFSSMSNLRILDIRGTNISKLDEAEHLRNLYSIYVSKDKNFDSSNLHGKTRIYLF